MKNTMPLHIEYVPAAGLRPAEYNPRKHDKAAADQLKESISRFSFAKRWEPHFPMKMPHRRRVKF